jgi:hypothetical protein
VARFVAVAVSKQGAKAVRDRLQAQEARMAELTRAQKDQSEACPAQPGAVARREQEQGSGKARRREATRAACGAGMGRSWPRWRHSALDLTW